MARQTARLPLGIVHQNDLPEFLRNALRDPAHFPEAAAVVEQIRREQGFRELLDLFDQGVWVLDVDGRTVFVNDRMASILGTTPGDMADSIPAALTDDAGRSIAQISRDGRLADGTEAHELHLARRDGGELRVRLTTRPILDADGAYGGMVATADDPRRPAPADRHDPAGEALFGRAFEWAAVPLAVVGRDGRLREVNLALSRMVGHDAGDLVGRPFTSLLHGDDGPDGGAAAAEPVITLTDGRGGRATGVAGPAAGEDGVDIDGAPEPVPPPSGKHRLVTADGAVAWAAVASSAVRGGDGRIEFFVTHVRDISARVRREAEARARRRRADALGRLTRASADLVGEDVDAALDIIAAEVTSVAGDFSIIVLDDDDDGDDGGGGGLRVRAIHHRDDEGRNRLRNLLGGAPPRPGEGLVGGTFATGRRRVFGTRDLAALRDLIDPRVRHLVDALGVTGMAALPLTARGRSIGVLVVGRVHGDGDGGYDEPDAAFLVEVADRVALAIDNARLYGALRASEERYRLVQHHAPAGIVLIDLAGRIVQANPAVCAMLQREAHELVGASFSAITPAEDVEEDLEEGRRLLAGTVPATYREKRLLRADGSSVWAWRALTVMRDEHGQPTHFVGQIVDITERRRTRQLVDAMFGNAPDLLAIIDRGSRFVAVSPSWTDTLGWTAADLVGSSYLDFVHPDDRVGTPGAAIADELDAGAFQGFENRYRTNEGGFRWLQWRWAALPDDGYLLASARDVTDQRRQADELRRSNEDLAQFAAIAAHDLKSPLGVIAGFAQLLQMQPAVHGDVEAREYAGHIDSAAQTMRALIDDLLDYCRIGTDGTAHRPVPLDEVVQDVLGPLTLDLHRRHAVVEVGDLPMVRGDAAQLRHLLQNLVTNAAKFVPEGTPPHIRITAERTADAVVVSVADNGIGIDPADRDRAFAMFQRLAPARGYDGTGIGLAICRRVVEGHGGAIWIEGNDPGGTRVRFTLPAPPGATAT